MPIWKPTWASTASRRPSSSASCKSISTSAPWGRRRGGRKPVARRFHHAAARARLFDAASPSFALDSGQRPASRRAVRRPQARRPSDADPLRVKRPSRGCVGGRTGRHALRTRAGNTAGNSRPRFAGSCGIMPIASETSSTNCRASAADVAPSKCCRPTNWTNCKDWPTRSKCRWATCWPISCLDVELGSRCRPNGRIAAAEAPRGSTHCGSRRRWSALCGPPPRRSFLPDSPMGEIAHLAVSYSARSRIWAASTRPAWRSRPIRSAKQSRPAWPAIVRLRFRSTGGVATSTLVRTVLGSATTLDRAIELAKSLMPAGGQAWAALVSQAAAARPWPSNSTVSKLASAIRRLEASHIGRQFGLPASTRRGAASPINWPPGHRSGRAPSRRRKLRRPPERNALGGGDRAGKETSGWADRPPRKECRVLVDRPVAAGLGWLDRPLRRRSVAPGTIRRRRRYGRSRSRRDSVWRCASRRCRRTLRPSRSGPVRPSCWEPVPRPKPSRPYGASRASRCTCCRPRPMPSRRAGRTGRDLPPRPGAALVPDHCLRCSADRSVSRRAVGRDNTTRR